MTPKEYIEAQANVISMGKIAARTNIEGLLQTINLAQSATPMVDPVLVKKMSDNLAAVKTLTAAALELKRAFEVLQSVATSKVVEKIGTSEEIKS